MTRFHAAVTADAQVQPFSGDDTDIFTLRPHTHGYSRSTPNHFVRGAKCLCSGFPARRRNRRRRSRRSGNRVLPTQVFAIRGALARTHDRGFGKPASISADAAISGRSSFARQTDRYAGEPVILV